jgi:hypothetical protein
MVKITIKTDNAVFQNGNRDYEISRVLDDLRNQIEKGYRPNSVGDINGNLVCQIIYTGKDNQ